MKLKKEFKIGLLSVIVLIATFVLVNYLRGRDLFGKEIELTGRFDNVETLVASAPVQIRGFAAGRVNSVVYDRASDSFVVTCAVNKDFIIPSDSRMVLFSTSIMGGKAIRIDAGTSDVLAKNGDELQTGSDADLVSTLAGGLSPLLVKVNSALDSVTALVGNVNSVINEQNKLAIQRSLENLNRTLANASALAASLGGKSDKINAIVDNLSELSAKLTPIAESAATTVDNLNNISGQLAASDIQGTVNNLKETLSTVDSTVRNVEQPLDSLLNNADKLIKEIQKNPKKYIKITVF